MPYTRIAKLLPLLSSDKSGEVVATAAAVGRLLAAAGLTWHDLAKRVGVGAPEAPKATSGRRDAFEVASYADAITLIYELYFNSLRPGFERDFVESNVGRECYSEEGRAILARMCKRFRIKVLDDGVPF